MVLTEEVKYFAGTVGCGDLVRTTANTDLIISQASLVKRDNFGVDTKKGFSILRGKGKTAVSIAYGLQYLINFGNIKVCFIIIVPT